MISNRRVRTSEWALPGAIALLLCVLFMAGPAATGQLRWDRAGLAAGQYWRLATGHLVHADVAHLLWNLLGVGLVWWLFGREFRAPGWTAILAASMLAIDAGLQWLVPSLDWYVGFSGVLHGCMAAGLYAWMRVRRDALVAMIALLFAAKILWEAFAGPLPVTAGTLAVPVIVQSHLYGAIGGLLAAIALQPPQRSSGSPV